MANSKARLDYHDCTTHLFVDSFARIIGEWCDKNKVMPKLIPLLKGKADGRVINEVVTELLGR